MINGKDKVSWVMADEKILKLEKLDKTYELSDVVFKFMDGEKLLSEEDFEVEVEIDESKGENGKITKLVPLNVKVETEKQEENNPENTKADNVTKTMTVGGVSVENKGIIFKQEEGVWYTLADDLDAKDIKANATKKDVNVVISPQEKGKDLITSLTVLEEVVITEPSRSAFNGKSYQEMTQASIESQVSVEHAQILAGTLFSGTKKSREELDIFIEQRAKKNYALIQELKNS